MCKIKLLGKVNTDLMEGDWYFVDYSEEEYEIGSRFKCTNCTNNYAKLIECMPDALYKWNSIPKGYKSICRFEFDKPIDLYYMEYWSTKRNFIILKKI